MLPCCALMGTISRPGIHVLTRSCSFMLTSLVYSDKFQTPPDSTKLWGNLETSDTFLAPSFPTTCRVVRPTLWFSRRAQEARWSFFGFTCLPSTAEGSCTGSPTPSSSKLTTSTEIHNFKSALNFTVCCARSPITRYVVGSSIQTFQLFGILNRKHVD